MLTPFPPSLGSERQLEPGERGLHFRVRNARNEWQSLYIGQADTFATRLPNHERWAEARQRGATHVHARVEKLVATRDRIEFELIRLYQPPMKTQLR